jgi:arsenate reductase-like glutaredoxin family protein
MDRADNEYGSANIYTPLTEKTLSQAIKESFWRDLRKNDSLKYQKVRLRREGLKNSKTLKIKATSIERFLCPIICANKCLDVGQAQNSLNSLYSNRTKKDQLAYKVKL